MARMIQCDQCQGLVEEHVAESEWSKLETHIPSGGSEEFWFCSIECLNEWATMEYARGGNVDGKDSSGT